MEATTPNDPRARLPAHAVPESIDQATVKVCLHKDCLARGGEDIYHNLKEGLEKEEALVLPVTDCFGFCKEGPNIAINDNIVRGVKPFLAVERVRQELRDPSCKADGLGSRSINDLDSVLDDIVPPEDKK